MLATSTQMHSLFLESQCGEPSSAHLCFFSVRGEFVSTVERLLPADHTRVEGRECQYNTMCTGGGARRTFTYLRFLGDATPCLKGVSERDTLSEAVVSLRTLVTFVTWLISRTEFSSSKLVP